MHRGAPRRAGRAGRAGAPAGSQLPALAQAREVGQALHAALFGSALGAGLAADLRAVHLQRGEGLRFVVDTSAAPELAQLPWEFLYSPAQDDFLFSDRLKPLVRRLDVDAPPPVLAVAPPLRLLVTVASPRDRPGLQVGAERAHLDMPCCGCTRTSCSSSAMAISTATKGCWCWSPTVPSAAPLPAPVVAPADPAARGIDAALAQLPAGAGAAALAELEALQSRDAEGRAPGEPVGRDGALRAGAGRAAARAARALAGERAGQRLWLPLQGRT